MTDPTPSGDFPPLPDGLREKEILGLLLLHLETWVERLPEGERIRIGLGRRRLSGQEILAAIRDGSDAGRRLIRRAAEIAFGGSAGDRPAPSDPDA